jgi:hypothetical protein
VSTNTRTALAHGVRERMCGCPQTEADPHPVSVGARHAVPLPFPDQQAGLCSRQGRNSAASLRFQPVTAPGFRIFSNSLAMSRQGGLRTRPYPDPTIRHSQFAIRNLFPFAIRYSPLATRYSLLAIFFHSPFAIRHSPSFSSYSQWCNPILPKVGSRGIQCGFPRGAGVNSRRRKR